MVSVVPADHLEQFIRGTLKEICVMFSVQWICALLTSAAASISMFGAEKDRRVDQSEVIQEIRHYLAA